MFLAKPQGNLDALDKIVADEQAREALAYEDDVTPEGIDFLRQRAKDFLRQRGKDAPPPE